MLIKRRLTAIIIWLGERVFNRKRPEARWSLLTRIRPAPGRMSCIFIKKGGSKMIGWFYRCSGVAFVALFLFTAGLFSATTAQAKTNTAYYTFKNRPPGEPFTNESAAKLMANTSNPIPRVSASATSFTVVFYGNESDFRSTRSGGPPPRTYAPMIYGNPWIWGWRVVWSTNSNDLANALYNVNSPLYVYNKSTSSPGSGQLNSDTWYTDIEATYSPDPPGNVINGNDPGLQGISISDAPGVAGSSIRPDTTYYFGIVRILANLTPHETITSPLNSLGYPAWYLGYTIPQSAGGPSGPDWVAVRSPGSVCGWTIQWSPIVLGQATTTASNTSGPRGTKWNIIR